MNTVLVTLSDQDARLLNETADALGRRPEELAAEAIRNSLFEEADWADAVGAGMANMDAGQGISFPEFCAEMDAFLAALEVKCS